MNYSVMFLKEYGCTTEVDFYASNKVIAFFKALMIAKCIQFRFVKFD